MKTIQIILLFSFVLLFSACQNTITTEENVINDILPLLVDSLDIEMVNLKPDLMPINADSTIEYIQKEEAIAQTIIEENQKKTEEVEKYEPKLWLAVIDTCSSINLVELLNRTKNNPDSEIISEIIADQGSTKLNSKKIEFSKIKQFKEYELISLTKLENMYRDIWENTCRKFGGILGFSRVYFDNEKQFGIIKIDYSRMYYEVSSYLVILEIKNQKWTIRNITLIEIS